MTLIDKEVTRKVDNYVDENHESFAELGRKLFQFRLTQSQIRNLQQVACSATRFADIEDFVKNQTGKTGNEAWKQAGDPVLSHLQKLRTVSRELATDANDAMAVRLRLVRGWVRAVVSEYLYQVARRNCE